MNREININKILVKLFELIEFFNYKQLIKCLFEFQLHKASNGQQTISVGDEIVRPTSLFHLWPVSPLISDGIVSKLDKFFNLLKYLEKSFGY